MEDNPERVGVVLVHGIGEKRRFEHLDGTARDLFLSQALHLIWLVFLACIIVGVLARVFVYRRDKDEDAAPKPASPSAPQGQRPPDPMPEAG